jgi:hypothetical protein
MEPAFFDFVNFKDCLFHWRWSVDGFWFFLFVVLPFLRWFFWDFLIKGWRWRLQTPPESEEDAQPTGSLDIDECYKILGCRKTASVQKIKKHYRVLVKMYHPDVILGTKRFEKIQEDVREKYIGFGMKRFRKIQEDLRKQYIDFGTKRFRKIHEAYERILQDRGSDFHDENPSQKSSAVKYTPASELIRPAAIVLAILAGLILLGYIIKQLT